MNLPRITKRHEILFAACGVFLVADLALIAVMLGWIYGVYGLLSARPGGD